MDTLAYHYALAKIHVLPYLSQKGIRETKGIRNQESSPKHYHCAVPRTVFLSRRNPGLPLSCHGNLSSCSVESHSFHRSQYRMLHMPPSKLEIAATVQLHEDGS